MNIAKFKFEGYKILKSSIEIDEDYEGDNSELQVKIKASGLVKQEENKFILNLSLDVNNPQETLLISIDTIGHFKYDPVDDIADMGNYFYFNSSAILFPYLRAFISTLSALSAIKTITLPTMNLTNLAAELKENTVFE
jgi:preprotein translocase subunit SecB